MLRKARRAALAAAAAILGFSVLYFGAMYSELADPPAYWVTIDEGELGEINRQASISGSSLKIDIVERNGGLAIVKLDELRTQELSSMMHREFHKCSGFIRHETLEDARRSIESSLAATTDRQFVDYSIDNQTAVNPMLAEAAEPNIRQTIIDLSALPNRRHNLQGGIDGAMMIMTKWQQLAAGRSDVTVEQYVHRSPSNPEVLLTPQPSIILTITGTQFPDEIVVLGGHQDSINGATGTAPGADDDASGIASLTEAIRVMMEKGFRPRRTVQFMAYAAEEIGLVGSNNIALNYRNQNKNVVGVIQLDMTNYAGTWADIVLMTDNTNAAQNQFIRDLVTEYQPTLVVKNDQCGYGCSDHKSWHDRSYPASMPFEAKYSGTTLDGIPRQYNTALHTVNDTIARSNNNANHALKFAKLAITFAGELAKGTLQAKPVNDAEFDFDGDGRSDIAVFRPSDSIWHLNRSQEKYTAVHFGIPTDRIVPADYDGDGKTDIAVYRGGIWHLLRSSQGYFSAAWGMAEDIPQPQDLDGDGKADLAVFRPSDGTWYVLASGGSTMIFRFGQNGDHPAASDFDGDGTADAAVYREGVWHVLGSQAGYSAFQFGVASDIPVTADFDGDGRTDATVFRDGVWYILNSSGGHSVIQWGIASDIPAPADYDGDGKADITIYRDGVWYILGSISGAVRIEQFGIVSDVPAASAFIE